jgi:hypothetical protein
MAEDIMINTHDPKRLKRYHVKVLGNAVLEKDGIEESFLSNTLNISLSGALIETSHIMPMGAVLRYRFKVPGISKTFNLLAEVVRSENETKTTRQNLSERATPRIYGIRFIDLTEKDRADIACYLFQ